MLDSVKEDRVERIIMGSVFWPKYIASPNDKDENGYDQERVERLLWLADAPLDEDVPEGEQEFMDWLNSVTAC